jgi:predicted nucleotidyltransferase
MDHRELLQQIKVRLQEAFGQRLHGVVLYGSEARGVAREDSDIDVLMLLEGPIQLGRDIHLSVKALYPLILQIGRVIDAAPVDVGRYEAGAMALYRQAKEEGIRA